MLCWCDFSCVVYCGVVLNCEVSSCVVWPGVVIYFWCVIVLCCMCCVVFGLYCVVPYCRVSYCVVLCGVR